MKLLKLYEAILGTGGLSVDSEGLVSVCYEESDQKPFCINGKRLVLPTKEHLSSSDWENRIIFHPLNENILRDESEVLAKFRSSINVCFNVKIMTLLIELMAIGANTAVHKNFTPDQQPLLDKLKDVDAKTLTNLTSMMENLKPTGPNARKIINIFLKRGGMVKGTKYSRAAIVSFPIYDELCTDSKQIFGVNLRAKDKVAIKSLFEFIFPGLLEYGSAYYNRGSHSDIAPLLDALMQAVKGIADPINSIASEYGNLLDNQDYYTFSSDWCDDFDNLAGLVPEVRKIPMQSGNEGATKYQEPPACPAPTSNQIVTPAPAPQPQAWQAPQPMQQQPYAQPQMQQNNQPAVVETGNGIDFVASTRNMPGMQQQYSQAWGQQPPPMQQSTPSWAQPAPQFGYGQPMQQQPSWGQQPGFGGGFNNNGGNWGI